MSSIASNAEDLILNADGGSSTVKFKIDGTEKASISSAGAFTSTTIDATKLTGNLPAISGANLTGVGVAGITSSADANAITISSSEKVRVGATNDSDKALLSTWQNNTDAGTSIGGTSLAMAMQHYGGANSVVQMGLGYCNNHPPAVIGYQVETNSGNTKGDIFFATRDTTNDVAPTERLRITVDGRGLSQFTAKAWMNMDGQGTIAIGDSHNVSSITDLATGEYRCTFSNNMANNNYAVSLNTRATGGGFNDAMSCALMGGLTQPSFEFHTIRVKGDTRGDNVFVDVDDTMIIVFGD